MTFIRFLALLLAATLPAAAYDPLEKIGGEPVSVTWDAPNAKRGRTVPLRVYLPEKTEPAPVVLFSHGLGGSRDNNPYLGEHWAARGYVAVFLQHPGSDEAVWKDAPRGRRMEETRRAASPENFRERAADVATALDSLEEWNAREGHPLHGRLDLRRVGLAGHSFGAKTTQAAAGETFGRAGISLREPRISAAVMMSPSPPAIGDPARAFAAIRVPCLLMTGTLDDSPIGNTTPAERLKVFPHLREAPAWQVVFDKGDHMLFRGTDPARRRAILALTTAFWDLHLKNDPAAAGWLGGDGPREILAAGDLWELNAKAKEVAGDFRR